MSLEGCWHSLTDIRHYHGGSEYQQDSRSGFIWSLCWLGSFVAIEEASLFNPKAFCDLYILMYGKKSLWFFKSYSVENCH